MGSFAEANTVVKQTAFANGVQWLTQATAVAATNGAPSAAGDGESIRDSAAFAVQVIQETATLDCDIAIWGYSGDRWAKIPSGVFETIGAGGLIEASVLGGLFERIYIEVTRLGSGQADLYIGYAVS